MEICLTVGDMLRSPYNGGSCVLAQTQHHGGCVCVGLKLSTMEGVCVLVSKLGYTCNRVCPSLTLDTMEGRVCAG